MKTKSLPIDKDLFKQQSNLIAELRQKLEEKNRRINYLEEVSKEHDQLKSLFASNGNLTYNQAYQVILTQRNAEIQRERDRIDFERESARLAAQEEEHEKLKQQVLSANPNLLKYCEDRKAKIKQAKDTDIKLASEFYELEEDQALNYFKILHDIERSAIKHLVTEKVDVRQSGQKVFLGYECNYCSEIHTKLSDFERHCYYQGDSHHDANMKRIEDSTFKAISKVEQEFNQDVENGIKGIKDKEFRARQLKERAQQRKIEPTLPFAKSTNNTNTIANQIEEVA